ncbi:hypothetical protein BDF20DRAFT_680428 [Mycotypha africana]|uniref:uncharacterized protein n=1 Tax=Mycotypha africana TaxID=64632 RepID=UPI0023012261|nr:uncharacterized protein BDF20DRAFT_680428 [Mycotypha africana]KAI8971455.1 hypothetical protein BDF20DRAFT_680428 [Mycotypha africana]
MSSLASLINSVKSNTANNAHISRTLKRKALTPKEIAAQKKQKKVEKKISKEPKVVVFDDSILHKKSTIEDKAERKRFMDSRINIPENQNKPEAKQKMSEKEQEEEVENEKKDVELQQLIATSYLLEELEREEMSSRDRRKDTFKKLEKLGMKSSGGQKMPVQLRLNINAVKKERETKKLQEAKDLGIYDKSLKHLYVKTSKKKRDRDPGITTGIGRMKGATLTISKSDLNRIKNQKH